MNDKVLEADSHSEIARFLASQQPPGRSQAPLEERAVHFTREEVERIEREAKTTPCTTCGETLVLTPWRNQSRGKSMLIEDSTNWLNQS
jgi:hypothetical protein